MDLKIHVVDIISGILSDAKRLAEDVIKFFVEKVVRPLAQVISKSARTLAPPVAKKTVKKSAKKRG